MIRCIALLILVSYSSICYGQCPTQGLTAENVERTVYPLDANYNSASRSLYVVGAFDGELMNFGEEQLPSIVNGVDSVNLFLLRYGSDGVVDWLRSIGQSRGGSTAARVKAMDDGAIAGVRFMGTVTLGDVHTSSGSENALLLRFNAEGDIEWTRHFESVGYSKISSIDTDDIGNIYVFGQYSENLTIQGLSIESPSVMGREIFLAKLNSAGDMIWLKKFAVGSGFDDAEVLIHKENRLYLSGFFSEEIEIGQTTLTSTSNNNGFVCSVDTSGQAIWVKQLMSTVVRYMDLAYSSNSLYMSGVYQDQLTIDSDILNSNGGRDGFVLSFDSSGQVNWMKSFGGDESDVFINIESISSDRLLVAGAATSNFNVDGLDFTNFSNTPQENAFTLLLDTSGMAHCISSLPSADVSRSFVAHISTDTLLQVGLFQMDVTVGDTTFYCSGNCGASFFLAKTCMGCFELIKLDIEEPLTNTQTLLIYPNPASQSIRMEVAGNSQEVNAVEVIDMLGHAVLQHRLAPTGQHIDISGLASGIYTLAATLQSGETLRQRLVVQH